MAISSSGIGSGLDVNSIVQQLMALEQRPLTLIDRQEASYQARLSGLGTLKGALAAFQGAASALRTASTVSLRATSSDSSSVAASAASTATVGSYSVNVTQLAQAQKLSASGQASATAAIGGGTDTTITFSFGTISGGTFSTLTGTYTGASFSPNTALTPTTLTIGAANNTLEGIRDAINAANFGVSATIINDGGATPYRLALTVADSGATNSLKIAVSGEAALGTLLAQDPAGTQQLSQSQAAQSATFTVDSIPVTSASNTVTNAIAGVTLTLAKVTTAPATVTVARDFSSPTGAVGSFVKAYNDLNASIASATAKGAIFQGNSAVIALQRQVRNAVGGSYGDTGSYRTLSALGATFQKDGTLKLDTTKLSAALSADGPGAVSTLASLAKAATAIADGALGKRGLVEAGTSGLNTSIEGLNDRREAIFRRLTTIEAAYRKQFANLDSVISGLNSTSAFLQRQLVSVTNNDK